ncbi:MULTISPECIES: aggregation-promoting factor C-terminal-like domain-containing protein [Streptomyces]|uniref:Putative secreted protein n=1 Tax=Streptomyces venezuelae (strain ATCC 10712 / CBS 650.69 / DSM 40230 / JCM 4526 / NBRC 13096 / PD 04745) TaxID=953739 RepID=F2R191_STRVP|nr:transglycosylase SLT domain-containing protein [Streptomyces venezuelae]APE23644.1 transglycosylase domain-containing protein [Streptomyces venezuelae]QES01018.1 lytic transglycosylase domain-containing protein [Streptomyces venezuelae ATCC 10712]QES08117.1 lytic transglycosylase domain-containing protein [Streptomyces venezuelae]QES13212.1 lytic transglycosylase domain-containing protein [Streptomyces venezuelae]CCA57982.1 putative secreted protein [Streptomyces venezuelae ATCC 10712]
MSRISVRGFAVASATAVTTVGAVVGVASGNAALPSDDNFEATAADTTLLADIPVGEQAQVQVSSLSEQADVQAAAADSAARKSAEEAARLRAAKDAEAKKEAADKAAKAEKERKEAEAERASRSAVRDASSFSAQGSYSVAEVKAIARQMIPAAQFQCFSNIVDHESGWNYRATNASSGAYGLVQALPGNKMASAGSDWQTNPATQIKWGLSYMNGRYGSPCGAWSFWQSHRWY